jgi:diaminopimelate epimerase
MTAFFKVSGGGNDFVALADPAVEPDAESVRGWCRRGISLGADGVFVIRRRRDPRPAIDMTYYNADGRAVELCLNGTRCAAQLAFHLAWAADEVTIHNLGGTFRARRIDDTRVALHLGLTVTAPQQLALDLDGEPHHGWSVTVGVPHLLLAWPGDLAAAPVVATGRRLRYHQRFQPAGTNVNWVQFSGPHQLHIRTYERGVEDETLACGTGVVAAAALGLALGQLSEPVTALTRGGFALVVGRDERSGGEGAGGGGYTLAGDARVVAAGELLPGALAPIGAAPATAMAAAPAAAMAAAPVAAMAAPAAAASRGAAES